MANKVSKIKLTEPQMLWLSAICSKLREGRQVSARALKVELRDRLPRDFDPAEIDPRLLRNEDKITLLGIGLLDPDSELVEKTNHVIQSVSECLQRSPDANIIGVDYISEKTKLPKEEVAHVFKELAQLGIFHDSGSNYGYGIDGWLSINIDKRAFDAYLKYESIKQILDTLIEDASPSAAVAPKDSQRNAMDSGSNIDIFISHSSRDEKVAEALADLLHIALKTEKIRCTSVPGYKLEPGASVEETLRKEIHDSRVFIGLITPSSLASHFVLFELGARWGLKLNLIPALASGADYSDLREPLKDRNPIRCDNRAEVSDLIDKIASLLETAPSRASVYQRLIDELVKRAKPKRERKSKQSVMPVSEETVSSITKPLAAAPTATTSSEPVAPISADFASWLLKNFLNGVIDSLEEIRKRFSQEGFVISASGIQLYSEVKVYEIDFFNRTAWNELLTSNAGDMFLSKFPSINDHLSAFGQRMDDFEKAFGNLEGSIEKSSVLRRQLVDWYARKMERERIPRSQFESLNLQEIAVLWLGELGLSLSNYPVESKAHVVRLTAYSLLELKINYPEHALPDDRKLLGFCRDLATGLVNEDESILKSLEEGKRQYEVIKRESAVLLDRLKSERRLIAERYNATY